jgi:membrane protease YdiL (CAAX protease family)
MDGDSPDEQPAPPHAPLHHAPGSRASRRFVAAAEALLCSSIPTQILIGALLRLAGWSPLDEDSGQLSMPFVLVLSIADTLLLIALMVVLTRAHGETVASLWLGRAPIRRETVYGALMIPVVFVMVVVLLNVLRLAAPWLHNVPINPLEQLAATPGQAAIFAVVAIFAGGLREELQRAFLLHRFEQHLGGAWVGVIVISVGFGLAHVVQGWDAVITTGLLGAFWAVMYLRRRSAVAPVVSHAGFNALEVLRVAVTGNGGS